jgi:hypothetical protein
MVSGGETRRCRRQKVVGRIGQRQAQAQVIGLDEDGAAVVGRDFPSFSNMADCNCGATGKHLAEIGDGVDGVSPSGRGGLALVRLKPMSRLFSEPKNPLVLMKRFFM